MFKRCLLAVIVALLVTSSQIAAAEDYDWSQAPRISSKAEFFRQIERERRNGNITFRVIFMNGFKLEQLLDSDGKGLNNLANSIIASVHVRGNKMSDGTERLTFTIREYPGTRVANAYLRGNTDELTMDEIQLYDVAVNIVNEVKKFSSSIEKARYIHDEICRLATFEGNRNTATGALVYGKADCDGYADSFYMLCRMCGFKVGRIGGTVDGSKHAWNWINLDGKTYCVDVTLDDQYNTQEWFLATFEVMQRHHSCDWSVIPNLQ